MTDLDTPMPSATALKRYQGRHHAANDQAVCDALIRSRLLDFNESSVFRDAGRGSATSSYRLCPDKVGVFVVRGSSAVTYLNLNGRQRKHLGVADAVAYRATADRRHERRALMARVCAHALGLEVPPRIRCELHDFTAVKASEARGSVYGAFIEAMGTWVRFAALEFEVTNLGWVYHVILEPPIGPSLVSPTYVGFPQPNGMVLEGVIRPVEIVEAKRVVALVPLRRIT